LTIQIKNPILNVDCQSQSNPLNWIAIQIEQASNPIQQYSGSWSDFFRLTVKKSKMTTRRQFNQHFTSSFYAAFLWPKNYEAKL